MIDTEVAAPFSALYQPCPFKVFHSDVRGTGKSWQFARALISMAFTKRKRILCVKRHASSLLYEQIHLVELNRWFKRVTKQSVVCKQSESEFLFVDDLDQDSIRAMEDIDICWIDDAEKIREESWGVLLPTILRTENTEIWISFDSSDETTATYRRFVLNAPDGAFVKKIGRMDNPRFTGRLFS